MGAKHAIFGIVVVGLTAAPAFGQARLVNDTARFWLDVGASGDWSAADATASQQTTTMFGEPAIRHAGYPWLGSAVVPAVEGGFFLKRGFGVGARLSLRTSEYHSDLTVLAPSPIFTNAYGVDSDATDRLLRNERGVDFFLAYDLLGRGAWRLRVSGGATVFRVSQELVSDIEFTQSFGVATPTNEVDITSYAVTKIGTTVVGFNAGVDLTYFLKPGIGISGHLRGNSGRGSFDDPLSGEPGTLKVGGLSAGMGLRILF